MPKLIRRVHKRKGKASKASDELNAGGTPRRKPVEGSNLGVALGFPGFMLAKPVSQVAAGYVNSGQRAIKGRVRSSFLAQVG